MNKDRKRAKRLETAKRALVKAQRQYVTADKAYRKAYHRYCKVFAVDWE